MNTTKRVLVGNDAIMSASDLVEDLRDLQEDITGWFSYNQADFQLKLHHELSPDIGCTLYYYEVTMPLELGDTFHNYFIA